MAKRNEAISERGGNKGKRLIDNCENYDLEETKVNGNDPEKQMGGFHYKSKFAGGEMNTAKRGVLKHDIQGARK